MSTPRGSEDRIEEIAADWLAQREEGLSPTQAHEFERWRRLDPRHAAAVTRLEQACALLEKMPLVRAELQPVIEFPHARGPGALSGKSARRVPLRRLIVGMAAVAAVGALGWWQWAQPERDATHYTTSASGYERVTLADGSLLELNASTEVQVNFTPHERRIRLTAGEAYFSVAHDTDRPFVVGAGDVSVRAFGTAFNVRLSAAVLEVLVTEGRVSVAMPGGGERKPDDGGQKPEAGSRGSGLASGRGFTTLVANERLLIPTVVARSASVAVAPPAIERVAPEAIREALAWQERKLVFAETPLREVVAQFNRRNRLQLVIGDTALAERLVGGTFAADNVEAFIRLIEGSGTVAVERRGEFEIVLRQVR